MSQLRQLAAIMFTDIVDYTALMGKDSAKALELVRISKEIQKPLVEEHHGQWLKEMGDGALAKFGTALDAVNCAVEIQKAARAEFDGKLRIGIHLGDITIEDNDVYGDGVNIASRLQAIADPGGIYISESIEKAIRGQSNVQAKYLGEIKLKNVSYDVRAYAVQGVGLPVPEAKEAKELSGQLWAEIQRRGIMRAAVSYLLLGILLILFWEQLNDWGISMPRWLSISLLTLLVVGFPIALYLAWNYELSPQGFVKTSSEASWQNPLEGRQKKPLTSIWIIILMLVVSLSIFFFSKHPLEVAEIAGSEASEYSVLDKSVAVLPLTSMTQDEGSRAFSDGQWEAILSQLSKIEDLRVISRQSTEQYRLSTKSAIDIAKELRVTHLVEGSVQKYGDQVRVTIQIIDAKDDRHLWAEEFTSSIENIFALHTRIATDVATQLELTLSKPERSTQQDLLLDTDVYEIYLSGVHLINEFHRSNENDTSFNEQAIKQLGMVINEESAFADAFVQLGRALMNRRYYGHGYQFSDTAVALLETALQLDPNNFEAHKYLGIFHLYYYEEEIEKGIEHLQKALQIDANDSEILAQLGNYYFQQAQFEKAIPLFRKSFRNNPTLQGDGFITRIEYLRIIGDAYRSMGMYHEAMRIEEKSMAINPNHPPFRVAFLLSLMGRHSEALPYYLKAYRNDSTNLFITANLAQAYGLVKQWERSENFFRIALKQWESQSPTANNVFILFRFGYTLWEQGKKDEAKAMFELHKKLVHEFIDQGNRYPSLQYNLACNYAYTGKTGEALNLLKDIPFWWVTYGLTRVDPLLDPIREHQEFEEILKKQHEEMLELRELLNMDQFQGDLEWVLYR